VGVWIVALGVMNSDVRDHASINELGACKFTHKLLLLTKVKFSRQCNFYFTSNLRVFSLLCMLNGIPKFGAMVNPRRRICWSQDFLMIDALLSVVVEDQSGSLICDFLSGTIGRSTCRTSSARAADGLS
jgi:hypothetical protein